MPGMRITDHQVRKFKKHHKTLNQAAAAAKVGISERGARRGQVVRRAMTVLTQGLEGLRRSWPRGQVRNHSQASALVRCCGWVHRPANRSTQLPWRR